MIDRMTTRTKTMSAEELEAAQAEALRLLAGLRQARETLDRDEVAAVAAARNLGLTWRAMAEPFGMTFQHMADYFGPLLQVRDPTVEPIPDVPTGKRARRRPARNTAQS